MNKAYRQGQILKLIRARSLHTQDELARALRAEGIAATQVTLSRDIRELGLVKTQHGYAGAEQAAPGGPSLAEVAREFVREVRVAQNQVVLRTPPAHANAVAAALDHAGWPEVVGTIAGDDTVLIVAPDLKTAAVVRKRILDFLK
jgi:transcriptional regulator of arginine metabolism